MDPITFYCAICCGLERIPTVVGRSAVVSTLTNNSEQQSVAYPGILRGTGHCTERAQAYFMGGGRHRLATGLYGACLHAELHSKVSGSRVNRVLIYDCVKCGHVSGTPQTGWTPQSQRYRACPECPCAGYATGIIFFLFESCLNFYNWFRVFLRCWIRKWHPFLSIRSGFCVMLLGDNLTLWQNRLHFWHYQLIFVKQPRGNMPICQYSTQSLGVLFAHHMCRGAQPLSWAHMQVDGVT